MPVSGAWPQPAAPSADGWPAGTPAGALTSGSAAAPATSAAPGDPVLRAARIAEARRLGAPPAAPQRTTVLGLAQMAARTNDPVDAAGLIAAVAARLLPRFPQLARVATTAVIAEVMHSAVHIVHAQRASSRAGMVTGFPIVLLRAFDLLQQRAMAGRPITKTHVRRAIHYFTAQQLRAAG